MTTKNRVRVVDPVTKAVHTLVEPLQYPSSRTPSPTFSDSTASSSTAPPTPQSLFTTTPLPAFITQIHPDITYNGNPCRLSFDLALPFPYHTNHSSPSANSDHGSVSSRSLGTLNRPSFNDPATDQFPPTTLSLLTEALPWRITVTVGSTGFVTVYDVLRALHSSLWLQVTKTEWNFLSPAMSHEIALSFHQRVGGISDPTERKRQLGRGVRRLDFLVGCTRLVGISLFEGKPDSFKVHWR